MATPSTADSDFLDLAMDTAFSGLESGLKWSFEMLAKIVTETSGFITHHWALFAAITLVAVFHRKFKEWRTVALVIAEYTAKKRMADARAEHAAHRARAEREREDAWLARADERRFRARLAELEGKQKYHTGIEEILREKAFGGGRRAAVLDAAIQKHIEAVAALQAEIDHLKRLWAQRRVLNLIDRLVNGVETDAKAALAELNQIWRQVDWQSFVPYEAMTDADQRRVIQLLEVMASNTQLGEARNAFAFAQKLLSNYQWRWGNRKAA